MESAASHGAPPHVSSTWFHLTGRAFQNAPFKRAHLSRHSLSRRQDSTPLRAPLLPSRHSISPESAPFLVSHHWDPLSGLPHLLESMPPCGPALSTLGARREGADGGPRRPPPKRGGEGPIRVPALSSGRHRGRRGALWGAAEAAWHLRQS